MIYMGKDSKKHRSALYIYTFIHMFTCVILKKNGTKDGQVSFLGLSFLIWEMGMTSVNSTLLGPHQADNRTLHVSIC